MNLQQIADDLIADLTGLTFGPPVTHVYNPLLYARAAWNMYCAKYGRGPREIRLLGMNPGPWGFAGANERGPASADGSGRTGCPAGQLI